MEFVRAGSTTISLRRTTPNTPAGPATTAPSTPASTSIPPQPTSTPTEPKPSPPPPPPAPKFKQYRGGGKAGRKNWSSLHVRQLLNIVETEQPIGAAAWESVSVVFNSTLATNFHRTPTQLRDKFQQLLRMKGTTGNPDISAAVQRARAIDELINKRFSVTQSTPPYYTPESESDDGAFEMDIEPENTPSAAYSEDEPPRDDAAAATESAPAAASSTPAAAAASSSAAAAAAGAPPRPPIAPANRTGKRKRVQIETIIKDVLERDSKKENKLDQALTAMATAVAAMATQSQDAQRRHEELMAILLKKSSD